MKALSTMWAPGLKPRWIREKRLAVSPMPKLGEEEKIANMFNTVVSLSPPSEHVLSAGYDPRALPRLKPGIKIIWRPIGEYNAPTLIDIVKMLKEFKEPVLVHCFRGCGRSSVIAAAWLMLAEGMSLPETLAEISTRTGCGPETAPQLSVLEAFDLARRAGLLERLSREFDVDDPVPEYLLLLARNLSAMIRSDPVKEARKAFSRENELWLVAEKLANSLDYKVSRITLRAEALVIQVWIPRRSHPSNVRKSGGWYDELSEELQSMLRKIVGKEVKVGIELRDPEDVPWL